MGSDVILVTGGYGFIGSALIGELVHDDVPVLNVDVQTYAGDPRRLHGVAAQARSVRLDVSDPAFADLVARERPKAIVHLAAETHVTRSETGPELFFRANLEGTRRVLEAAERCGVERMVHISTDEVYGPCYGDPFRETEKRPGEGQATSAYARSKALADDLARSYSDRIPVVVARPTNCFGPWQHPEKAIARWSIRAITGERLPVWGDGRQVRDWMYVEDACAAIRLLLERGAPGETYNIAPGGSQRTNLDIARAIARCAGRDESAVYLTPYDRPNHDRRYAVDASKMRALGWAASVALDDRLCQTVEWYRSNQQWWGTLLAEAESIYQDSQESEASTT